MSRLTNLLVDLVKSPSKSIISSYHAELVNLFQSTNTVNTMPIELFVTPIQTTIKKIEQSNPPLPNWSDLNQQLLECLTLVLDKYGSLSSVNVFSDTLAIVSLLLTRNSSKFVTTQAQRVNQSEEFLSAAFRSIQMLFKRASFEVLDQYVYTIDNLTSFGLLVSLFLEKLIESTSLHLRLECLNSLSVISNAHNILTSDSGLNNRIGLIFSSFLPGVSIKLVQGFLLAQNLTVLNHKIVCASLSFFGNLISRVFDDQLLHPIKYTTAIKSIVKSAKSDHKARGILIDRDPTNNQNDWLTNSSQKVFVLVERLTQQLLIVSDDGSDGSYSAHRALHLSLVEFSARILNTCYLSLNKYADKLLKILIRMAANSIEDLVGQEARKGLKSIESIEIDTKLVSYHPNLKYIQLDRFSILNVCMEEVLLKLPRLMHQRKRLEVEGAENDTDSNEVILNDDSHKLNYLKTLHGYLTLIDAYNLKDFFTQLDSLNNLAYLLDALLSCVQFDYNNLNNFFRTESTSNHDDLMTNYSGLGTFLAQNHTNFYSELAAICIYIGRSNLIRYTIDQLLFSSERVGMEQSETENQALFLVNLLLAQLGQNEYLSQEERFDVVNLTLTHYLNDSATPSVANLITEANRSIIKTCLKLELIRSASKSTKNKFINKFLIDTLYYLLENMLSSNLLVRAVCGKCLNELAQNLSYESMHQLLAVNFDFIMNDLILKISTMRTREEQSTLVLILCSLIEISDSQVTFYLNRLVDDLFFKCELDPANLSLVNGLCSIMSRMAKSMRRWYPVKSDTNNNGVFWNDNDEFKFNFDNLNLERVARTRRSNDYFKSFVQTLQEVDADRIDILSHDDQEEKVIDDQEEEIETKKQVPLYVKLQSKCLDKCQHLISHPDRSIRLRVIEIVSELSKNLAYDHVDEFLPVVHKLWSPILHRFSLDSELVVKIRLVYLLFDLSVLCGDFLTSRFVKEFLKPRLCNFMKHSALTLLNQTNKIDPVDMYTQSFKFQQALLSTIDKWCILFDIKECDLEYVIETCVCFYLDKRQPSQLQHLATEAIRNMANIDPDIVWLSINYLIRSSNTSIKLKHSLATVQLAEHISTSLLDILNSI